MCRGNIRVFTVSDLVVEVLSLEMKKNNFSGKNSNLHSDLC